MQQQLSRNSCADQQFVGEYWRAFERGRYGLIVMKQFDDVSTIFSQKGLIMGIFEGISVSFPSSWCARSADRAYKWSEIEHCSHVCGSIARD